VFEQGEWLNQPAQWKLEDNRLHVITDRATDFWRETHYGFTRDSGHCYGVRTAGDFTAQVRIDGRFETLYDQAGLMVRIDASQWVKTDGQHWPLLRLAPFPHADSYFVGPTCCTPERGGLAVEFSEFRVGAPNGKALHDLT